MARALLWASEVLLEGTRPTLTKLEVALGDRIDVRTTGRLEVPHTLNERKANIFIIFSALKQVVKSPNTSKMFKDVIKNRSHTMQKTLINTLYRNEIKKNDARHHGNLDRPEVSKIEDRVQFQK